MSYGKWERVSENKFENFQLLCGLSLGVSLCIKHYGKHSSFAQISICVLHVLLCLCTPKSHKNQAPPTCVSSRNSKNRNAIGIEWHFFFYSYCIDHNLIFLSLLVFGWWQMDRNHILHRRKNQQQHWIEWRSHRKSLVPPQWKPSTCRIIFAWNMSKCRLIRNINWLPFHNVRVHWIWRDKVESRRSKKKKLRRIGSRERERGREWGTWTFNFT